MSTQPAPAHTPTPWAISGFDTTTVIAIQDGPNRARQEYVDGRHQYTIARAGDIPGIYERAANAALIVRAVNSHAALVEALEYLIGECDEDMDDDYNPHAAPLARARAGLATARPPVDVDVAQIAASTDAKGETQ